MTIQWWWSIKIKIHFKNWWKIFNPKQKDNTEDEVTSKLLFNPKAIDDIQFNDDRQSKSVFILTSNNGDQAFAKDELWSNDDKLEAKSLVVCALIKGSMSLLSLMSWMMTTILTNWLMMVESIEMKNIMWINWLMIVNSIMMVNLRCYSR